MKLMEFKITESENKKEIGGIRYIVKLSTKNERELYERTNVIAESCLAADIAYDDWDNRLKAHLDIIDDNVFYYIMEDEKEPKVGGILKLDDIKLKRIN